MTDTILKRRSGESDFEYKVRVCLAKLNKEIDLDWIEIVNLLELECSSDHLRKLSYAYKEMSENGYLDRLSSMEDSEILDELEMKKIELLEERKKIQVVTNQYNKIAREKARRDMLFEKILENLEKLPVPKFEPLISYYNEKKEYGILGFGDIHFGKIFESIHNSYSEEISKERMTKLIEETVEIVNRHGFNEIIVVNGADSIEGMTLRVSQLQSLQSGMVDQTIKFAKFMASWLNELSKYVKIKYIHIPSANHSEIRPHNSSRGEFPAEDMEKVIMHYVHDVLEYNDRVEVVINDRGFVEFELAGFQFGALHGHQLKGNKNAIRDLSMLHKKFYDYLLVYHFHHGNTLTVGENGVNNVEILQMPSIMGADEYADSLMTGGKAGAKFMVFQEGKGRTIEYSILLN